MPSPQPSMPDAAGMADYLFSIVNPWGMKELSTPTRRAHKGDLLDWIDRLRAAGNAPFDVLKQVGPARVGFEVFYTGRQALEDNPYRSRGFPHVLFGGLIDRAVGKSRVYVNVENLGDVRQTRENPLLRPVRGADGTWTVDAWAPLEGRTLNAGVRWRF